MSSKPSETPPGTPAGRRSPSGSDSATGSCAFEVTDDGIGFDLATTANGRHLANIEAASCTWRRGVGRSCPGEGTTIEGGADALAGHGSLSETYDIG